MSTAAAQQAGWSPPPVRRSVPRVFQTVLILYVLLTGDLIQGAQAALFGLQGGGGGAFTLAVLAAVAVDIARIAPIIIYSRHPLGILHPLILTTVLWPLLVAMPGVIDELGGFGGLLLGDPVRPPFYAGLGWLPGPEIWSAVAWAKACELIGLLATYGGYALARGRHDHSRALPAGHPTREFDGKRLRTMAMILVAVSVAVLLVLVSLRGGLAMHLADMARGRFRSLAGLGPLVSAVDLGLIALIVWVAARPADVKQPLFLTLMVLVAAAQFISNGARVAAFEVFMLVGISWALRTRRIPWRLALILVPLFFLSFGALNIIRTSGFTGQTASEAIQDANTADMLTRVEEEIDLRQSLESTVPVIAEGQDIMGGPLWGRSYGGAVFAVIPRWLWQGKPRGPGSLYAQNFLGEVREGLAIPVNPTAEEYWNFGILGVILMSLLFGALIRYAHNFYMARQENPFAITAFVLFVTTFHLATDDLVLFQQDMGLLVLVYFLGLLFASTRRRTAPRPVAADLDLRLGGPQPLA